MGSQVDSDESSAVSIGLSLTQFMERFEIEAQCETALEERRWRDGFVPLVRAQGHYVARHGRAKTFQCQANRHQTALTSGTTFHSNKLPLMEWFQAMYLLTQSKNNVSARKFMRVVGVCYRTAWRLKHKVLEVMAERESIRKLEGRAEVDDAYLGGAHPGRKRGRGSQTKVPFIAAIETFQEGRPLHAIFSKVKTFRRAEVKAWAIAHLTGASIVVSDGLACLALSKPPARPTRLRSSAWRAKAATCHVSNGSTPYWKI